MTIDIAYLTNDLMFSSRVTSLARTSGVSLKTFGTLPALIQQLAESSPAMIFVDLEHPDAKMAELVQNLSTQATRPKIVAYGPHVKQAMLDAAQAAGVDTVLSRGQFDKQVASILQSIAQQK